LEILYKLTGIEDGFEEWETIYTVIKFKMPLRFGEPAFYRWHYDGRVRWNLNIGATRIQWGLDHDSIKPTK